MQNPLAPLDYNTSDKKLNILHTKMYRIYAFSYVTNTGFCTALSQNTSKKCMSIFNFTFVIVFSQYARKKYVLSEQTRIFFLFYAGVLQGVNWRVTGRISKDVV